MKRPAFNCSKMGDLKHFLNLPQYQAVGLLDMLWHLTATEAQPGDIGRIPDKRICRYLGYEGNPEELMECLFKSGWIDKSDTYRWVIHDWHDHAEDSVKIYMKRNQLAWASKSEDVVTYRDMLSLPKPKPLPKPLDNTEGVHTATGLDEPDEPTQPTRTRKNGSVPPSLPSYLLDENFVGFRQECDVYGMRCSEEEWQDCYQFEWTKSSIERQLKAREDIRHRTGVGDRSLVDVLPKNYLRKAMWERNVRDGTTPSISKHTARDNTALATLLGNRKASASVVHMTGRSFSHGSA